MAALEKIRSKAGFLIFIIAFALLCFIIGDLLTSGNTLFGMSQNKVGKVNGKALTIDELSDQTTQLTEMLKGQQQQQYSDAEVRAQVWTNFVQSSLLEDECDKAHLTVSPAELSDNTVGSHPHPMLRQIPLLYQEGRYNPQMISQIIAFINRDASTLPSDQQESFINQQNEVRNLWVYWEKKIKDELYAEKLSAALAVAMSAPKAEVDFLASLTTNEYDALVARKQIVAVPDADVKVDSSEAEAFYNKVKDARYKTEGYRDLLIAYYPVNPSNNDINVVKEAMDSLRVQLQSAKTEADNKAVFANSDHNFPYVGTYRTAREIGPDYSAFAFSAAAGAVSEPVISYGYYKMAKLMAPVVSRPDSVKISMIPVQAADSNAAKTRADSIAKAIKAGANFEDMVAKYNKDDKNKGEVGWIREGMINMDNFDNLAFNSAVGSVFTVKNAQASFVIKVTDKTAAVKKAKVAILALPVEASKATLDSVYGLANDLAVSATSIDSFKSIAQAQKVMVRPLTNLEQNQPSTYVLPNSRCLVKWAWDEKNKIGSVSNVFSDIPNSYVVVCLTDMGKKGYIPFNKVKDQLMAEVINGKKADKLMADMAKCKSLAEVGQVDTAKAVRFSSNSVANIGNEPSLVGAIVASKPNTLSKPVKGNNAVYMFQVTDAHKSQIPAFSAAEANQSVMRSVASGLVDALKDKADIEDNRYKFY